MKEYSGPAEKVGFFQTFQYCVGPVQAVGILQRRTVCNGQEKVPVLGGEAVGVEIADIGGIVLVDIAVPHQIFQKTEILAVLDFFLLVFRFIGRELGRP